MAPRTDDDILEEIRERFTYGTEEWRPIREEGATDMRFIAGDCWEPEERTEREDQGRVCLAVDELSQYVNQLINQSRQNKRGIKVTPQGNGANDQTAAFRQGLMRQIEYRSNAPSGAYVVMFENTAQRSYGFLRIKAQYVGKRSFEQELLVEPLPNPDLVTMDPTSVRTDGKDWRWGFIHESRTVEEFRREYPHATVRNFTADHQALAPAWFDGTQVQIAEYWTIEVQRRELLLLKAPARTAQNPDGQPIEVFVDELAQMPSADVILKRRWVSDESVRQYFTNGFELLAPEGAEHKFTAWPGSSIPIVPCYGKVLYVDGKKQILSLIRLARDPQMLYAYYRTCQAELVGMTPKFPYFVYEGQLDPEQEELIAKSLHEPVAVIKVKPTVEALGLTPGTVLPLPQRQPYEPPIQALEMGAEAARRAIQAAIGSSPLPTAAQRRNEKSGVALDRIDHAQQVGNFHFVDHYDEALTRTGAILDELIPHYYDTAREVAIRKPDDSLQMTRINDPRAPEHVRTDVGDHDVTISTGPSFDSDREAAADFATVLAGSPMAPQIMDLVIKLRNLGPIGDEIAERLTPPQYRKPADGQQPLPPAAAQAMAHAQQQVQQLMAVVSQLEEQLKTDRVKVDGQIQVKQLDLEFQRWKVERDSETKITVAELTAKVDRLALFLEERARLGDEAANARADARQRFHEATQAAMDRTHDVVLGTLDQAHALQKTGADTAAAAALADQGHGQALELQASAPPPTDGASA